MTDHKTQITEKITSVIAREGNGNVQITFTIPFAAIKKAQDDTIAEMAKDMEIPGFRKGNAPLAKVTEKIPQQHLVEHSLGHLLPQALSDAIEKHKLKIAIYPKFELISAKDGEAWQIKGVTCELPEFELGDYKKAVQGSIAAKNLWTPDKGQPEKQAKPTREEMESIVIGALLENIKIEIPQILIEDESDSRLSNLLARLEKLGLALESYLASINKRAEDLRAEYASQARSAISLDLILNKIAQTEKIEVTEKEIDEAMSISNATKSPKEDPESRKRLLESILKRRKALDFLVQLS